MHTLRKVLFFGILALFISNLAIAKKGAISYSGPSPKAGKANTPGQGISGEVRFFRGNNMPMVGVTPSKGQPVSRTILIYELTKRKDCSFDSSGFFSKPLRKLLAKTKSDAKGHFKVNLPEGKYSVFVLENDTTNHGNLGKPENSWRHYANLIDAEDNIFPVEVKKGELSPIVFKISYRASF